MVPQGLEVVPNSTLAKISILPSFGPILVPRLDLTNAVFELKRYGIMPLVGYILNMKITQSGQPFCGNY